MHIDLSKSFLLFFDKTVQTLKTTTVEDTLIDSFIGTTHLESGFSPPLCASRPLYLVIMLVLSL